MDGLHQKASPFSRTETERRFLDLHGTLHLVHCKNGHVVSRQAYQDRLSALNPSWKAFADEAERTGTLPATNPDGDVRPLPSLALARRRTALTTDPTLPRAFDRSTCRASRTTASSFPRVPNAPMPSRPS